MIDTKATGEQKLEVSTTVAAMVRLIDTLDLDVLDEMLDGQDAYHAIEPIMDPTRYRTEARGMDATWAVLRAARDFKQVVEKSKAGNR